MLTKWIDSAKFYLGLLNVLIRLIRKQARLLVDPMTKEILILDPIANETWVLSQ